MAVTEPNSLDVTEVTARRRTPTLALSPILLAALIASATATAGAQVHDVEPPAAPAAPAAEAPAAELLPNGREPLPGVVTGGEPTAEQLAALAARGFRTVVSLRTEGEPTTVGQGEVEALGMRWVQIPVAGAEGLTRANAGALGEVLADPEALPAAVYCGSGNRVGALLALEAVWVEGADPAAALELGREAGLTRLGPAVEGLLAEPGEPPRD